MVLSLFHYSGSESDTNWVAEREVRSGAWNEMLSVKWVEERNLKWEAGSKMRSGEWNEKRSVKWEAERDMSSEE